MESSSKLIFDERLLQRLRLNLQRFNIQAQEKAGLKQSAVAITVVETALGTGLYGSPAKGRWSDEAAVILTKRSLNLKNHSGQWALPGGRVEAGETAEATALRELAEEVDLALSHDNIIGRLDDFTTRSGFVITPVVVWGGTGVDLTPNPDEVSAIHRIPVTEFLRRDAPLLEDVPEGKNPILFMPVGNTAIAAPTAALLYQFREVAVLGKETRVAHYEQPFFAWK